MERDSSAARRPATSNDVARLAGVSQATVSYVLNDTPGKRITAQTRARVLDAAARLGYVPSASAQSLRSGQSNLVLIPIPDIPVGQAFIAFLNDLTGRLRALGYEAVIYGGDDSLRGAAAARAWARWRPVALLADGSLIDQDAVDQLHAVGTQLVIAVGSVSSPLVPSLVLDDTGLGAVAAGHLLARGCRRLGVLMPAEQPLAALAGRRRDGVRQVAPDAGEFELAFSDGAAAALAAEWAATPGTRPDGVFAYNDEYAMLLLRYLQDAGLSIPEDVAVVGADDLPLCTLVRPRLTTVRMKNAIRGADLAERIHAAIGGATWDAQVSTEVELIIRESA
jgi:DNA-binding LacI/PurR family transcriptional regulator